MRLALHDLILPSAGEPHPDARTRISDAARGRWVRTMHGHLARAGGDGSWFGGDLDVGGHELRMDASRHGTALTALWAAGPSRGAVAASVLMAGRDANHDAGALSLLRGRRLPICDDDYQALGALAGPCLATVYLDARWYDNARVELAATALALAALYGPEASMKVLGGQAPAPAPLFAERPSNPLPFDFTRERLRVVMGMVAKKTNAALQRRPGPHFTVQPPDEFLARPGLLRGQRIFDRLKDTVWRVRWFDRQEDRLCFGDFLGFLDQLEMTTAALPAAAAAPAGSRPAPAPAPAAPVKLRFTVNARDLVTDATIRRLLDGESIHAAVTSPPA